MIIRKVKVRPFGGLIDDELALGEGLNVVLGPNEAGKSTLYKAVQAALFTKARLTKAKLRDQMGSYLPIGGDTAQVELEFTHKGKEYVLRKTWGPEGQAELRLPGGSVVTDDDTIDERLDELLPAAEATCRSVLMAYQSGMARTVEEIRDNAEAVTSIGDILRASLHETDGVSVDVLRDRIDQEYEDLFSRWDYESKRPENPGHRYTRGVGEVLQAHYDIEDAEAAVKAAEQHEEQLDTLNKRMAEQIELRDKAQAFVTENKKAAADAQERRTLEAELGAAGERMATMQEANSQWPVLEAKAKEIEARIPVADKRIGELKQEEQAAQQEEQAKSLRERFKRAAAEHETLAKRKQGLESVQTLTAKDLQEIKKAETELEKLRAVVAAGKLELEVKAKKDLSLKVQPDFEAQTDISMAKGGVEKFSAGARLRLEHTDWEIVVTSGEQDVEKLTTQVEAARSSFEELLKRYKVTGVKEAERVNATYDVRLRDVSDQESKLSAILEDLSYEDLKHKVDELGPVTTTRATADVVRELTEKQSEKKAMVKELETVKEKTENLTKRYGSGKDLVMALGKTSVEAEQITRKIKDLAPLPEAYDGPEAFLEKYGEAEEEAGRLEKAVSELQVEAATLRGEAPDLTSEEASRLLAEAKEEFAKVLSRGNAVARISQIVESILEETDTATYAGLEKALSSYVAAMTSNRYKQVSVTESMPEGFVRGDGTEIPYELLSTGTKDVLALALRLTMATYFLGDAEGFMMMDDPLVDLDPERQAKAAEAIRSFASDKQLIVFTCHPSHAELLGKEFIRKIEV